VSGCSCLPLKQKKRREQPSLYQTLLSRPTIPSNEDKVPKNTVPRSPGRGGLGRGNPFERCAEFMMPWRRESLGFSCLFLILVQSLETAMAAAVGDVLGAKTCRLISKPGKPLHLGGPACCGPASDPSLGIPGSKLPGPCFNSLLSFLNLRYLATWNRCCELATWLVGGE